MSTHPVILPTDAGLAISGSSSASTGLLERQLRARIDSLSYLPTTVAVAMKFVELSRDPEVDPAEYTKVIASDSSLSSKILSLANSSWFGVRNTVTRLPMAVNLLGLATVRTLAMSYCLTGLHHELRLNPNEARMFWASSLCKAVAARQLALRLNPEVADEAFTAGLFQDLALPVMYATARQPVLNLLHDATADAAARLQQERALFGMDHTTAGRMIAQKLELPELFVDAVAFHHDPAKLHGMMGEAPLTSAVQVAALFPHLLNSWNRQDAAALSHFLGEACPDHGIDPNQFLEVVQREFDAVYRYFEQGAAPEMRLAELLEQTAREAAENTTRLVGAIYEALEQTASAGQQVHHLMQQHEQLEEAVARDPLTGALNRDGFCAQMKDLLVKASRYGIGLSLAFFDVDHFKGVNDTYGHARGDVALGEIVACMRANVRQTDLIGRLGGDEFALLLSDCSQPDAMVIVDRILAAVRSLDTGRAPAGGASTDAADGPAAGATPPKLTLSAGLLWIPAKASQRELAELMARADQLMYEAKKAGRDRIATGAVAEAANPT